MHKLLSILRAWKLPVAMAAGAAAYFLFSLVIPRAGEAAFYRVISHGIQPGLIFVMLFLSFLKVEPHHLRPHRWHAVLLGAQGGAFVLASIAALAFRQAGMETAAITAEGAMLCFICPTATAAAVVVSKLRGSMSGIVTYLVVCNIMVTILAPAFLTLVEPRSGLGFWEGATMIMGKVFPILLCPLLLAILVRHYAPALMRWLLRAPDMPFYLWLVALPLAITVTVRTIVESRIALLTLTALALVSLACCIAQFAAGRAIGRRWQEATPIPPRGEVAAHGGNPSPPLGGLGGASAITAGQAFGQKNTVMAIWMGLVFLDPVTSVVGGFYSIWHNSINSWQLYRAANN